MCVVSFRGTNVYQSSLFEGLDRRWVNWRSAAERWMTNARYLPGNRRVCTKFDFGKRLTNAITRRMRSGNYLLRAVVGVSCSFFCARCVDLGGLAVVLSDGERGWWTVLSGLRLSVLFILKPVNQKAGNRWIGVVSPSSLAWKARQSWDIPDTTA